MTWIWRDVLEMRCLSFLLFPRSFILFLSTLLPMKNVCPLSLSHTHLHSQQISAPTSLWTHTKGDTHVVKHKLFPAHSNKNRHVRAGSHLDASARPGLLCFIKNSIPIIVRATNRWRQICLALAEVMWKLLFFSFFLLGLFWGLQLESPLSALKMMPLM